MAGLLRLEMYSIVMEKAIATPIVAIPSNKKGREGVNVTSL